MILKVPAAGGVNKDAMAEELALGQWSDALNVRFRNGYAEKVRGISQVFSTPSVTPYFVCPFVTTTARYWAHAGTAAVYVDDGTTRTDITGTAPTGAASNRWSGGAFGGYLVLNNGVDVPMSWDGNTANNLVSLTGWDANERAFVMRGWKNYLFALRVKKTSTWYPYTVKWSSAADPGSLPASWDETNPAVDAGEVDLAETPDLLIDAMPLGDALIIYKERSMYAARYIGGTFIFQFQRIPGDVGMLAPGCGTPTPRGHVVLTAGDVILHDGASAQSIAENIIRRHIFDNLDSDNFARAFVTSNPTRNEVWVCYPEAGQTVCNRAAVWNWVDNTWSLRSIPNCTYGDFGQIATGASLTYTSVTTTYETEPNNYNLSDYTPNETRLVLCGTSPVIALADTGNSDLGGNISTTLERVGISLDDSQSVKIVRGIWPRIDAGTAADFTISVGATMTPDAVPTYSTPVTFRAGVDVKVDTFATGRYLAIKIESANTTTWRMRGFDVDAVQGGLF